LNSQSTPRAIVLIGPPGSGKTCVGQILARRLSWRFQDTDKIIEERLGQTVPEIFRQQGEGYFREQERLLLDELGTTLPASLILATGGGIAVAEGNFERLCKIGLVICLRAGAQILASRLSQDEVARPLLQNKDNQADDSLTRRLEELLKKREEAYARPRITIDTSGMQPSEVAEVVEKVIRESKQSQ